MKKGSGGSAETGGRGGNFSEDKFGFDDYRLQLEKAQQDLFREIISLPDGINSYSVQEDEDVPDGFLRFYVKDEFCDVICGFQAKSESPSIEFIKLLSKLIFLEGYKSFFYVNPNDDKSRSIVCANNLSINKPLRTELSPLPDGINSYSVQLDKSVASDYFKFIVRDKSNKIVLGFKFKLNTRGIDLLKVLARVTFPYGYKSIFYVNPKDVGRGFIDSSNDLNNNGSGPDVKNN